MRKNTSVSQFQVRRALVVKAPASWRPPCANTECTLHQLSPYIGKLKSVIAADLIDTYSNSGDLIVDPFAGAGTVPLEASLRGRRVFAADVSPYSRILSVGKLSAPFNSDQALQAANSALEKARKLPIPDLRKVPVWVRRFFNPHTLREVLNFASVCRTENQVFLFACLLGILHHQRPGFLSYPSSHLVPYLRNKSFPRESYPDLYEPRALRPRLLAKIERSYKRIDPNRVIPQSRFVQCDIRDLALPREFDALITSPPYMNALELWTRQ